MGSGPGPPQLEVGSPGDQEAQKTEVAELGLPSAALASWTLAAHVFHSNATGAESSLPPEPCDTLVQGGDQVSGL